MTRTEFLLARRNYADTRSSLRLGLVCGVAVVVLLALRYAPRTNAERPHVAIVGAETVAVVLGFRFVDKVCARHLLAAYRLNCTTCGANPLADGGKCAILSGRCAKCHATLFKAGQDFESAVATHVGKLTRSQYLMLRAASEKVDDPARNLIFAYLLMTFSLTLLAVVRFPHLPDYLIFGFYGLFVLAFLIFMMWNVVARFRYRRFVRSPLDCP